MGNSPLVTRLETEGPFLTLILPAVTQMPIAAKLIPRCQVHVGIFLPTFLWALHISNSDIHIHIFLFTEKALNTFHFPPLTQEIIFIFFSI